MLKSYTPPETKTTQASLAQVFLTLSEEPKETTERAFKRSYGSKSFALFEDDEFNTGFNLISENGQRFFLVGSLAVGTDGQEIEMETLAKSDQIFMESKKALGDGKMMLFTLEKIAICSLSSTRTQKSIF